MDRDALFDPTEVELDLSAYIVLTPTRDSAGSPPQALECVQLESRVEQSFQYDMSAPAETPSSSPSHDSNQVACFAAPLPGPAVAKASMLGSNVGRSLGVWRFDKKRKRRSDSSTFELLK